MSPLQYLQTRRLLSAKQLLADTPLPITQVALVSGFGSVRRFNAAFTGHYGLSPGALRREGSQRDGGCEVRLGYRPPYDVEAMLGFFRTRAIEGLESVGARALSRTLAVDANGRRAEGWLGCTFDEARRQLLLRVSDSLHGVLPLVIRRVRAAFDLDADPHAINAQLHGASRWATACACPARSAATNWRCVPCWASRSRWRAHARWRRLVHRFGTPIATPDRPCATCSRRRKRWRPRRVMRWASWASCASGRRRSSRSPCRRARPAGPARRRRCSRHGGGPEGAGHRRLDGAVHRDARAALAGRLSPPATWRCTRRWACS